TGHSVPTAEPSTDSESPLDAGQHYVVEVEYCAAEEDDSVDPEHFRLLHGDPAQLAHVHEAVEDPLEARELTVGQCASGNLWFYIADDSPSNVKVDYRPGDLGSLTWAVKENE